MSKLDFLSVSYVNTAPGTGNRLNLTIATGVTYNRALYLQYIEVPLCRIYDTVTTPFGERTITSCNAAIVTSTLPWLTYPNSVTLGTGVVYQGNGYGGSISPQNGPMRVDLGDIYVPATSTFDITAQIYCPGFINTDRVDMTIKVAFMFETERARFAQTNKPEEFVFNGK